MSTPSFSPVRVGLIGFGNIGTGVVRWMRRNEAVIRARLPRPIELARIADIDIERDRGIPVSPDLLTPNADDILDDPSIDIVIELIGGVGVAREVVEKALRAGKHVVTANKALLAVHGADLMALAREKGVVIGAEASVGAGIPLIRMMHQSLAPNRFNRVAGIVNGTCNYILSEMEQGGKSFQDVLAEAQRLGYAEPDPTFDIEGVDTGHKLAILASLAFGQDIRFNDVAVEGISRLKPEHMNWAARDGLRIKLLAVGREVEGGKVDAWVGPTLVKADGQLGSVNGPFNAVLFDAEPLGPVMVYGRGAGPESTSSGVLSDVMTLAAALDKGGLERETVLEWPRGRKDRIDPDLSEGEFVLSLEASDAPGGASGVFQRIEKSALPLRRVELQEFSVGNKGTKGSGLLIWAETAHTQFGCVRRAAESLAEAGLLRDQPVVLRVERES